MTISKILLCFDRAVTRQDDIDVFEIRQDFQNFQFTVNIHVPVVRVYRLSFGDIDGDEHFFPGDMYLDQVVAMGRTEIEQRYFETAQVDIH